jgi:hypothetical protein
LDDHSKEHLSKLFQEYLILGKSKIEDARERDELVESLRKGLTEFDGSFAICFRPRHGLRIRKGAEAVEVVICFECQQVVSPSDNESNPIIVPITRSAEKVFDSALRKAGLPVAK